MAEQNLQSTEINLEEIRHVSQLLNNYGSLCLDAKFSDVILVVEGQKLPAHKTILAARSHFFLNLLYGKFSESKQKEVVLEGDSVKAFKILLNYIYVGHVSLADLDYNIILDTLSLANKYGFPDLEDALSIYLSQILCSENVFGILIVADLCDLKTLKENCYLFIDRNALKVLKQESFLRLPREILIKLLQRNSFFAPEKEIFLAVRRWMECNRENEDVMGHVRLSLMEPDELLKVVAEDDALLKAVSKKSSDVSNGFCYRGQLIIDEDLADPRKGFKLLEGTKSSSLFATHNIKTGTKGIILSLGVQSIVNHIQMVLTKANVYSYYVEVSVDGKNWVRIIDYSKFMCKAQQLLYFTDRVVKLIKIVGTYDSSGSNMFQIQSIDVRYQLKIPQIVEGCICPNFNVATSAKDATVVATNGANLFDGSDSTSAYHQIGAADASIKIQLPQPYILSSLRFLLLGEDRDYSYYVQVSTNGFAWTTVVDKQEKKCKSWQTVRFRPRPVVFINIIGTRSSFDTNFHCVHFECPSLQDIE